MEDDQIIEGCRIIREVLDGVVQKFRFGHIKIGFKPTVLCAFVNRRFLTKSDMIAINWWAVLAAGFSALFLGGIWYSLNYLEMRGCRTMG